MWLSSGHILLGLNLNFPSQFLEAKYVSQSIFIFSNVERSRWRTGQAERCKFIRSWSEYDMESFRGMFATFPLRNPDPRSCGRGWGMIWENGIQTCIISYKKQIKNNKKIKVYNILKKKKTQQGDNGQKKTIGFSCSMYCGF